MPQATSQKTLQKASQLLDLVAALVKKYPKQEDFYLRQDEIAALDPLLQVSSKGLDNAITTINKVSAPVLEIERGFHAPAGDTLAGFSTYSIHLEDKEEISRCRKKIKEKPHEEGEDTEPRRLIHKDKNGYFYYADKVIDISPGTLYCDIFDILITQSDQEDFVAYKDIEKELVKRGHDSEPEEHKRNVRIQNAITNEQQGLFRQAKVNGRRLENKIPQGGKLIRAIYGRGLQLNNPLQ